MIKKFTILLLMLSLTGFQFGINGSNISLIEYIEDYLLNINRIGNWHKPSEEMFIAHALGGIDQVTYSNSLDAFYKNYEDGKRWFEVDIYMLKDGNLVCFHQGHEKHIGLDKSIDEITTKEFLKLKYKDEYTLITFKDLLEIVDSKQDVYIVIDIKKWTAEKMDQMITEINEINPKLILKIIPQIYKLDDIELILDIEREYGMFYSIIFTIYNISNNECDQDCKIEFMNEYQIPIITMPKDKESHTNIDYINRLHDAGYYVFTHTSNDEDEIDYLSSIGVDGFYTDFYIKK